MTSANKIIAGPSRRIDQLTPAQRINPIDIREFTDRIQIWNADPLPIKHLKWLQSQSGGIHVANETARFNPFLNQRIQLWQPSREALQSLATLRDTEFNYQERSLDLIFGEQESRDEAYQFACQYHVKQHHRDQLVRFCGTDASTRYSGPRRAPNVLVVYCGRPSKVTGAPFCVHFDWRIRGVTALRRAGFYSIADVLKVDHRQFWRDRLLMKSVNLRAFGRQYHIHVEGKGRRTAPWMIFVGGNEFPYDLDRRAGANIVHAVGSTQEVIDQYRKRFPVSRCLDDIDIGHLLPKPYL